MLSESDQAWMLQGRLVDNQLIVVLEVEGLQLFKILLVTICSGWPNWLHSCIRR